MSDEQRGDERILPLYQVPYGQKCTFEETEYILLFNKRNYKASVSVGFMTSKMHPLAASLIQVQDPISSEKTTSTQNS